MKIRTPGVAVVAGLAGLLIGCAGTAGAQPAARTAAATVSVPSYCTSHVTVVRQYSVNVDPGSDSFRSGVAGHGGKLNCITIYAGNYAKTLQFNPSTGGWPIPITGINGIYFNCFTPFSPPFRWSPTGKPYNDCAEEYAKSTTTADGGLHITWPDYNGSAMYPPTTPYAAGAAVTSAVSATLMGERPPECVKVRVENPNGHIWWLMGCGTGSGGETWINPALAGHGPLQVDGAYVQPNGCGSFANPCVVVWAKSPPS